MRSRLFIAAAVAATLAPAGVRAQGTVAPTAEQRMVIEQAAASGVRTVVGAVETKTTTGRPYSAESLSELVQVLGDGNRISRRTLTRVYRDGEGRTRREMLADDGSVRSISISDPVGRTSYTLDPKTKVAMKSGATATFAMGSSLGTVTVDSTRAIVEREAVAGVARGGGGGAVASAGGGGRGGAVVRRVEGVENPNVKKEDLGTQNIEGVMATGTRTTTTIPAGEIGNTQEIRIVSEQWFSDELQALVMTRHSDPRSGENTYRLRNILRAEPDPALFSVPADYTVRERGRQPE